MKTKHNLSMSDCFAIIKQQDRAEFLILFEAWAKLAQQWLVSALHLEQINKELMLLVTI